MLNTSQLPFLIAEISANHCGSISTAKKLIKSAKMNGASAVKLQTYTPDTMTIKSNKKYFRIDEGLWKGYELWDLYNDAHTPYEWHQELFNFARKLKISIFSTPFDETAVDLLQNLRCPIYKVASFEMGDTSLIKKISKTKKPIIISTGTSTIKEIDRTYSAAKRFGIKDITLLYCVSKYPSDKEDFNINNIKILKDRYRCRVGLSDHSKDIEVAKAAIAAGAEVIEKHIALENQKKGLDIEFSLKGSELKEFRIAIDSTYKLLGKNKFFRDKSEKKNRIFRRSIFAIKDIPRGAVFKPDNIKRIRPGYGISPYFYDKIIGKKSPFKINKGDPIKKNVLLKLKIDE